MHPIIRLVNRNITISINPGFLIWQVIFPLVYIFVAGFAYTALIDNVSFGNKDLTYPAFLASGMIGFNIMNSTLVSGIIIWNDRRHGMFEQIMSGPFTRTHYILSNIAIINNGKIITVDSPNELKKRFGNEKTIKIHVSVDIKKLETLLQEIPDYKIEQDEGTTITIQSTNSEIVLMNILKILNHNNITVNDLSALPTNLEEIFLKVVSDSDASNN